ncbi:unnamed protein product [Microthlaspi erraticum]|uniref:Uncharacterized protein n=1 Tax=Microthlaspi erraticum TaxID=1685480 RepID=A0A6D2KUY5_9BRAS|nr:unnamed protein product [Microthlaspi erraticum]
MAYSANIDILWRFSERLCLGRIEVMVTLCNVLEVMSDWFVDDEGSWFSTGQVDSGVWIVEFRTVEQFGALDRSDGLGTADTNRS